MRFTSMLSGLLLAGAAVAQNTSCSPTSADASVLRYAYALQGLLERYYTSQPIDQSFFGDARNGSTAQYYQNFHGIQRENRLGVRAILQVANKVPGYSNPTCDYSLPDVSSGEDYVANALRLEGSVAAAFIGATGYTQSPEVSFILARLASQHTAGATWLAAQQTSVLFQANSSALVPAYNPAYVLGTGDETGRLGQYLGGCVSAPANPCGQAFYIGPLIGSIGNITAAAAGPSGSPSASASASASVSPTPTVSPTGAAKKLKN
ncbi:hypothetical protein BDV18DRAFT_146238 [Aspergillus unguis]